MMGGRDALIGFVCGCGLLALGCAPRGAPPRWSSFRPVRGSIAFIGPQCAGVRSCLVGQVTAAETSAPLQRAAVFLERISSGDESDAPPVLIPTLTDEQGAFIVVDAPPGNYRIAVYKGERRYEGAGLRLGLPGTMMVPVSLAPG